jgi:regulator of protease activity HflC (stomatin/prohibitin superfamily)
MEIWFYVVILLLTFALSWVKIVKQYERKVFSFGKYSGILHPGLQWIIPLIQTVDSVDIREKAVDVPS